MILLNKFMARKGIIIPNEYVGYYHYYRYVDYQIDVSIIRTNIDTNQLSSLYYNDFDIYQSSYVIKYWRKHKVKFVLNISNISGDNYFYMVAFKLDFMRIRLKTDFENGIKTFIKKYKEYYTREN